MSCNYPPDQTYCVHVTPCWLRTLSNRFFSPSTFAQIASRSIRDRPAKLNIIFSFLSDRWVASGEQIHLESHFELHLITGTALAKENISAANTGVLGRIQSFRCVIIANFIWQFLLSTVTLDSGEYFPFTSALCSNHYLIAVLRTMWP